MSILYASVATAASLLINVATVSGTEHASNMLSSTAPAGDLTLPPATSTEPGPFYPAPLRRLGLEGSVVMEFRIAGDGAVADLRVIKERSDKKFVDAAVRRITSFKFTVPSNWSESGHVNHIFRVRVAFVLTPCPDATDDPDGTAVFQVCGTRLPR